jgi:hypothetical protein
VEASGRPWSGTVHARLRCGRKKKVAGWAVRVGWAGQEAEAQWEGEGKSAGKKKIMRCSSALMKIYKMHMSYYKYLMRLW